MKKLLLFIAILISTMGLFAQNVGDNTIIDYEGYSLMFTVTSVEPAEYAVSGYSGKPVNVIIPSKETISGKEYTVTSICEWAFSYCYNLTSIEIPNTVTSIGKGAFYNCCYNLTSIEIPNSVTSIGDGAFYNCDKLTSIEIPNSVTSIGNRAFLDCDNLTSIEIPNSVTSIGYQAFEHCYNLTSIEIPNSVTSIGGSAFNYCYNLTSIEIPNSVTSIGEYAFFDCNNLTSIEIPNSVTSIGEYAFANCSNLTSITVEDGNPVYDSRNNCNAIIETEINTLIAGCQNTLIPNSVNYIGDYAFSNCYNLTSIEIPNSVTSIGEYAFFDCNNLTSIEIPNSVTSIGEYAFAGCENLTSITVEDGNPVYDSRNNCNAIIETETNTLIAGCQNTLIPNSVTSIGYQAFYNCDNLTSIEIPNSVTSIGDYAFSHCSNLTSIEIPNSVTSIGESAFYNCYFLTSIEIPNSVTSIGDWAFYNCSSLTSIEIPNSVTSIGYHAFDHCSNLTSIEIPNSVTSIGESAFYNCYYLTSVYCYAENVPETGSSAFNSCPSDMIIYVPAQSVGAYKAASPWNEYTIEAMEEDEDIVVNVGDNTIVDYEGYSLRFTVTSIEPAECEVSGYEGEPVDVTIPSSVTIEGMEISVTSIGYRAFCVCYNLTSIEIPNSVTSIGDEAFYSCDNLTSIEIPNSVTSIGEWTFYSCDNLTSIEIPNSVTSIGYRAFSYCYNLTSIEIPNSVTSIGNYAFSECDNLTSITVEEGNPVYDSRNNCNAIIETETNTLIDGCQNTIIPNSVTSIGNHAFSHCDNLTSIEIPNSVTSIGIMAFYSCSNLTSIEIPNSVTSIGNFAFSDCYNLTSIYCYAENVPEAWFAFGGCPSDMVIYVPAKSLDAYKAASPWNEYTIEAMGEIEKHWVPDESLYANNMSVIGLIQIDGVNQNSTSLEIGAFCGEEVRGSQLVQYIPELDKYLVFLTIHGDNENDEISFRLYNHETEEELDLRSPKAITFTVNGTLGSVTNPYILNFNNMVEITASVNPSEAGVVSGTGIYAVYDTATLVTTPNEGFAFKNWTVNGNVVSTDSEYSFVVTEAVELVANYNYVQTRELKSGWSWFSSFIEFGGEEGLEMMEDALGENGLQIKNQTEFVVNSDGAWYGSLMAANSDMMFMLETSAPQTFTLVGPKVNPEEHPLTVGTNWRWISYPLDINLSVEEALATIVPQTGDYIKSKNAFSQYYEGAGWLGALSTMNPGEGYMYQNVSGTTKTLVYPSESATRSVKANVTAENNYWVPNAEKFAGNMSVIAVVESNGIEMSDYEVAAFVGDEIRGSARPIYIEVLDKHMIFMTVYGSDKEEVTFKYYDINADAIENVTSREEIVFADNATYGSIENAIVLTCGVTGIGENDTEALNVYPNPANVNAEISLGTTYDRVEIYNAIGVKIAEYADVNRIGGIEVAGVYVIKVMNDDATRNCRIVIR